MSEAACDCNHERSNTDMGTVRIMIEPPFENY